MLLGVLAVLLAIYLADLAMNRGNVPRGTAVGGVEIGGMSQDEATAKLEAELGETASNPVTVKAATQSSQLVPAESGLGIDWEATVASAGEESANPFTRLAGLFRTREVDIVSTVNEAALTPQLERVAGELHLDPADGAIAIEGGEAKVTEPVPGQEVDKTELFERVTTGWLNPDGVEVEPREIEPAIGDQAIKEALDGPVKAALSGALTLHGRDGVDGVIAQERIGEVVQFPNVDGKIAPEVNVESAQGILGEQLAATETQMKNARVLPGGGVEPSVDGSIIDWEAAMDGFDERLIGSAERTWDAQYKARPADFTTEEAQRATFDQVVGSFTTGGYRGASGTNIATVARVVNGAIVNPGETFSLNGYTGARGAAQGYVESVIIENGRPGKAVGGGISQFATTLYNAAYFAGMTDVASTPHSYYISRYPAGREATVYEGAIDLQFRNDSPHPVKISTSVGGGEVTVSLMGTKTVEVESINGGRWAYTSPKPVTVTSGDCIPSGGAQGFTTSDTRIVRDLSGNEISRNTSTTVYDPQPIVRCG
ncbi:VanW family protein [Corynebacterium sanguinis]|uniref:VanW family protein n=2 Tax=Corynebacterium sanguinis TaxID=2594913 RepID=A0A6I7R9J8_9CORY|nr:VanW family protein [Corynebacterium sanguinis]MBA4504916.1 VanW family protein [Corynebacterium sanguinis]MCT1585294.1 VanW family protein [Corynebacterium sanguinis]MCT1664439.1 VanW family protein [Corynebacterium sanguinis]MCT2023290.1 VanW family protein [Corynebacterium sanguinis]MCT2046973.1 VanW family protein [Corynebacterium sanguinis]